MHESADDTSEVAHLTRADALMDALMDAELAALITSAAASVDPIIPLTVQLAVVESEASEVRDRRFIFTVNLTLDVVCRAIS